MNLTTNKVHHHTPCASSVLDFFGVRGVTWNDRTKTNVWDNTLRRAGFSVRSRTSKMGKNPTVGGSREKIRKIAENEPDIVAFVARIQGHVLIIDRNGDTIVDTAPRKRDRRKLLKLVAIIDNK